MPSGLDSPAVRYGISAANAAVVAVVAFLFLAGTLRWLALGIAALEVVVTPQILKRAG
jgi:hypothetical protein